MLAVHAGMAASDLVQLSTLMSCIQQFEGMLATLTAYEGWRQANECVPKEALEVLDPDGGAINLPWAPPVPLRVFANCRTLVGADADIAGLNDDVTVIRSALERARDDHNRLLPRVQGVLRSTVSLLPEEDSGELWVRKVGIAPSRLVLLGQVTDPQSGSGLQVPTLSYSNGELTAQFWIGSGSLTANLQLNGENGLPSLSGTARVDFEGDLQGPLASEMVPIRPGNFRMGSGVTPLGVAPYFNQAHSQPVHDVRISRAFWMARSEVTQASYLAVMGSNPSFHQGSPGSLNLPVEQVTWDMAVAYCGRLTESERLAGRLPGNYVYRLPTEAEWEYCCRAEVDEEFVSGSFLSCAMARFNSVRAPSQCVVGVIAEVESLSPNLFGLHDMHGNVWEWCLDSWDGSVNYPSSLRTDPLVTSDVDPHVLRGGSFLEADYMCRSAERYRNPQSRSMRAVGFRVALGPAMDR
jgi:formylglycine-generating enzyme required for sulfatase activity